MKRVLKFGGTSIETADRIRLAAHNIKRLVQAGDQVAVVVSAQGNDTNLLLNAVYAATDRHIDLQSVYQIAAMGEEKSVLLMCAALRSLGLETIPFAPAHHNYWPLIVDCEEGAPLTAQKINEERPLVVQEEKSRSLFQQHVMPLIWRGGVPVLSGFFGQSSQGTLTTLGRGGSDISGVLVGRMIDADEVVIVTDVEGILSADPRLAPQAELIETMSIEELEIMASRGARVVHPRALRYKTERMNVRVVDYRKQEQLTHTGTTITGQSKATLTLHKTDLGMLTIVGKNLSKIPGVMAQIDCQLEKNNIAIYSCNQNDTFICLYIQADQQTKAYQLIHQIIASQSALTSITLRKDITKISLRSPAFLQTPGVLAEMTATLARKRINIIEVITSATDIDIYLDQSDAETAYLLLKSMLQASTE